MASNETVNIWVKVQGNAEKALKGVSSQLKKNDSQVKKNAISWKGLATAVGGMAILVSVNAWTKENVRLAGVQEKAEAKLANSLGRTSQELLDYASALQKKTTFGDEDIIASTALVASFIKEEEQIKRIIKVSQDLAVEKGMSLSSATDLVTKSVASSTNAMSRYGIEIEGAAGSVERIDSAVNALNEAFGGTAEALALTDAGQITQMENEIDDLREEVGEKLMPAMIAVKQATLDFYNVVLDNNGAVVSAIQTISKTVAETVEGWDFMINGGSRADAVMGSIKQLENINKEISSLSVEIGKASDDLESYLSADGASDDAVIATMEKRIDSLINQQILAEGLLRDLDNSAKGHDTEAEAIDKATQATDHNTASIKENSDAKKDNIFVTVEQVEVQRINRDSLTDALEEEREIHQQRFTMAVDFAQQTANQVSLIMSAVNNRRQQDIDRETKQRKDDVKDSAMSAKQKAKALEKIDEDAAKKRHELALKEWKQNLVMSIVNTALGVTKALSSAAPPLNFILAGATGIAGGVATGIIGANKPKFYNGRTAENMSGMGGDVIPALVRRDETILTPTESREHAKGGGGNMITIGAPQVTIQGDATPGALDRMEEIFTNHARTFENMFVTGEINPDIVKQAMGL